ncbi:hypothetical protein OIU84_008028, partial [Salix udensis]
MAIRIELGDCYVELVKASEA